MADSREIAKRRMQLFDRFAAGEIDKATYESLSAELAQLDQATAGAGSAGSGGRWLLWCVATAALVAIAVWLTLDRNAQQPAPQPAVARPTSEPAPAVEPTTTVAATPAAAAPDSPVLPGDAAEPAASDTAQPVVSPPPSVTAEPPTDPASTTTPAPAAPAAPPAAPPPSRRRLEYRFEPGKSYAYYVHTEADVKDHLEVHTGSAIYTAQNARPPRDDDRESKGTGTAFVVHPDGWLITCAHCVDDAARFEIAIGGKTYEGRVVATDDENDIALVHIEAKDLAALPLGDSEKVQVGEEVRAFGFPLSSLLGDSVKATRGTVSGIECTDNHKVFQIDAAINPGNSGGPLVRESGEVVGVNFAKVSDEIGSGVGLAVPIEYAKRLLAGQSVSAANAAGGEKLDGPALVQRVSQSVALLTVTATLETRSIGLACTAHMIQARRHRIDPPDDLAKMPGLRESLPSLANVGTIVVDPRGRVLDVQVPSTLTGMTRYVAFLIIEKLPGGWKKQWKESELTTITLEQEEIERFGVPGFGGFGPRGPGGFWPDPFGPGGVRRRFGPPGFVDPFGIDRERTKTSLAALEEATFTLTEAPDDKAIIAKRYSLKTLSGDPKLPKVEMTGTGRTTFDTRRGLPLSIEFKASFSVTTGGATQGAPIKIAVQLIEPEDLERYRRPEEITKQELDQRLAELRQEASRSGAIIRLGKVAAQDERRDEVVAALEAAASDSRDAIRATLVDALVRWGTDKHVATWIRLISDSSPVVQHAAIHKVPLKDARVVDAIVRHGFESSRSRTAAAIKLRELGAVAEPAVLKSLAHADVSVRREAMDLLKTIGTEASIAELEKFARSTDYGDALRARDALKVVCTRAGKPAPDLPPLAKPTVTRPDRPPSEGQGESSKRARATKTLADAELDKLLLDLNSVDNGVRKNAAERLAANPSAGDAPREIAQALEALATHDDVFLRRAVVKALGMWGTDESVPKLVELLEHQDVFTQGAAIEALARFDDERAIEALAKRLPTFFGRREAAKALKDYGPAAEKYVVVYLEHDDRGVRREVCDILKEIGTTDSIAALEAAAARDNFFMGKAAADAIAAIKKRAPPPTDKPEQDDSKK
jgi:S1-C subfamily serine protease/HEAT repeat protein